MTASNFGATPAGGVYEGEPHGSKTHSTNCVGGDPTCPCQDGLLCHYVDDPVTETAAMEPPEALQISSSSITFPLCPHCGGELSLLVQTKAFLAEGDDE